MKSLVITVALAALLLTSGANVYAHDGDRGRSETCFNTTSKMKSACRADIADDFYTQKAKCLNTDDPKGCAGDAWDEYTLARTECNDQAEGRNSLCERLPDAGPYITDLDTDDFNGVNGVCPTGQNRYFPLVKGTVTTFVNNTPGEEETVIVTVTEQTREIQGIETMLVTDLVFEGNDPDDLGDPIEATDDYYAIDKDCNVWYFGEVAQNFEDGYLVNLDGSFIAGEDDAQAGIVMLADPQVGDVYRQEFALGDAEDAAEVVKTDAGEPFPGGDLFRCDSDCLVTEDFAAPDPAAVELKTYAPGVGIVAEQLPGGEVILELVNVETP